MDILKLNEIIDVIDVINVIIDKIKTLEYLFFDIQDDLSQKNEYIENPFIKLDKDILYIDIAIEYIINAKKDLNCLTDKLSIYSDYEQANNITDRA